LGSQQKSSQVPREKVGSDRRSKRVRGGVNKKDKYWGGLGKVVLWGEGARGGGVKHLGRGSEDTDKD